MENHRINIGDGYVINHDDNFDLNFYKGDPFGYESNKAGETVVANTLNQWHNNWTSFCKAPKGFDVYVRMRYDTLFHHPIQWSEYTMHDDTVYIPKGNDYREGINDQMAFGSWEAMRKYYSVYLLHPLLFSRGKLFHTESYLKWALQEQGVQVVRIINENTLKR